MTTNYKGVYGVVLKMLRENLDEHLRYHSIEHTLDVIESVERLAALEKVNGHDLELLKTAALFHDLGFTETYDGHELSSVRFARQLLPDFGFSSNDIDVISGMIMATEIPQSPKTRLEKIIADADLDYLGRDDLFIIGQRLQFEWKYMGKITDLRDWHEKQLTFLIKHHYFTNSAKKLREHKKQASIRELEKLLD
jgi:HD superfamily phosphodiesterase